MSLKSYLNFDLLIDEQDDSSYKIRVINSPAGQATGSFTMPLSPMEIENFILKVGQNRSNMRSFDLSNIDISSIDHFGGQLFTTLFSGDILDSYRSSYATAKSQNKGLRIRLRLSGAPKLIDVPWEFLYDQLQRRYVGLSINSPIIRSIDLASQTNAQVIEGTLNILVMISSPAGYPSLDVEREWRRINAATKVLQDSNIIKIDRLKKPTLSALQQALQEKEYHIFHFIGHGGFDHKENDGVLVLEDELGRSNEVKGQYLGTLLHDEESTQLVILNSCNGARTSVTDPFAGVGQSLLQQGISAVIAMQFEITDDAAITFSNAFYLALIRGYSVDAAVSESRKAIFAKNNKVEWATPVLYSNTDKALILKLPNQNRLEPIVKEKHHTLLKESYWLTGMLLIFISLFLLVYYIYKMEGSNPNLLNIPKNKSIDYVEIINEETPLNTGLTEYDVFLCDKAVNSKDWYKIQRYIRPTFKSNELGEVRFRLWGDKLYDEVSYNELLGLTTIIIDKNHGEASELHQLKKRMKKITDMLPVKVIDNRGTKTEWRISIILCPSN